MDLFTLPISVAGTKLASPKSSPKSLLIIAVLAAVSAPLMAQQPYAQYAAPNSQYTSPYQPYGYAQPQSNQPQYVQPQYAQPLYQYAQPQQQYAQPQYPQGQPYASQPGDTPQDGMVEQPGYQQAQPALSADQLEQLIAPIALYPDQLLAEILTASTYPAQVAVASQWLQQMQSQGAASSDQIAAAADTQSNWDPSVKALTAFPQVLEMMDHNLEWTANLGNAYYNQPQDIMQTVQVMRQRAEDAGNLQSTPQEQMTYEQGAIELAPANPQMVYVPAYNPWDVYGQPVSPYPGFSLIGALGSFFGGAPIHYGLGIAMAAFGHTPFGLVAWGLDWLAHSVLFQHSAYFTHSTTVADWGFPRGGPRAYGGWARNPRFAGGGERSVQANNSPSYGGSRLGQPISRPTPQYSRPEQSFARPAEPLGRPAQQFARPGEGVSAYPRGETFDRSYPAQGYDAVRPVMPTQQAYNRVPQPISRPQPYAASPYAVRPDAYGYANRPAQTFTARPGTVYTSPSPSFRAPQASAPRAFAQQPSRGYSAFSSAPQRPGGFQSFNRGNEAKGYAGSFGGGKAPKAPKNFGGGGSHFKAPKASHSSGGGRKR